MKSQQCLWKQLRAVRLLSALIWLGAALLPIPATAGINTWTTIGPEGGAVPRLFINQSNPLVLYAATRDRFYRSVDGGTHWQLNTGLDDVADVAVDPMDPNRVYLLSRDLPGMYLSTDAGATFTASAPLPTTLPQTPRVLVAADQRTVYLLLGERVFVSIDRGASWEARTAIIAQAGFIQAAKVDLTDPNTVYVSLNTQASFVTRDAGRSWQTLTFPTQSITELATPVVQDFAMNPADPQRLFAGVSAGLFVSSDQGRSWTRRAQGLVNTIGLDSQNPQIIYIHLPGALRRSRDDGVTWTDITDNLGSVSVDEIVADPGTDDRVLVTSERGILVSASGNGAWRTHHTGINAHTVRSFGAAVGGVYTGTRAAAFIPHGGDEMLPVDVNALFNTIFVRSTELELLSFGPSDDGVLGFVGGRIGRSEDGGKTWRQIGEPFTGGVSFATGVSVLAASAARPATILAVTDTSMFRSTDNGDSFHDVTATLPSNLRAFTIAFSRSHPSVAYAGVNTRRAPAGTSGFTQFGVYKTADAGATWTLVFPFQTNVIEDVAVDPQDSEVVYVALLGTLMKSINGGTGWVDLRAGVSNLKRLRIDPLRPQILNIVSAFGVTRSVNGGKTWNRLPQRRGDTFSSINQDVTSDPGRPGVLRLAASFNSIQQMTIAPDLAIEPANSPRRLTVNAPTALSYTITNRGPHDASGIAAMLQLPDSAQDASASLTEGTCSITGTRALCTTDALLLDQPQTVTLQFTPTAASSFTMRAEVSASELDPDRSNNVTVRTLDVIEPADLQVVLDGPAVSSSQNNLLSYRTTVSNRGPGSATDLNVVIQLASGLLLSSVESTDFMCTSNIGGTAGCTLAALPAGQQAVIRVAATATSAGTFRSSVRVSADSTDPSAANDFAEIATTVMAPAAPDPQPQPQPPPPAAAPAKRGGGGGMDLLLLSMLALLAASRVVLLRKSRCGRYSQS